MKNRRKHIQFPGAQQSVCRSAGQWRQPFSGYRGQQPSGDSEIFKIVRKSDDQNRIRIQAPSGLFLQAKTQDLVTADYAGDGGWGDDNPSVFVMSIVRTFHGEFQVTNGYGQEKAPEVMREHWNTFIVEKDFKFISQNGLDAVRIPVGWWIASDPTPPTPFVGGSLQALDNAFTWAEKYDIQVIIDLHAVPGSQNGNEHSGTRDGSIEWGKTDDSVQQSVAAIDFLASRYEKQSSLLAIELLNEPGAPEVSLDTLKDYYQQGYDTVRKYSSSAYVIMSNRLGPMDDGTKIRLKSVTIGKYVCAENGGGTILVANRTSASGWETFKLWRINENTFNLRVSNNQFAGVQASRGSPAVVAVANTPKSSEIFRIVRKSDDKNRVRIQAPNGKDTGSGHCRLCRGWWLGDDNPSVFVMKIVETLQGEFQVTNGYGPDKAPQVMGEHWSTFIVEDDFRFISQNGLNAVRIPIGWWIASDPTPPKPFVGGSLQSLDNAFTWAQKYGVQVIIDLHAAPGAQNGYEHSGTRDGTINWGKSNNTIYIQQTVAVIDFLTSRYAKFPNLLAVELLNEPLAPVVTVDTLKKYYKAGYDAVRKHSSSAYVMMNNRLKQPMDPRELFPLASALQLTVIDVHYYSIYDVNSMSVKHNLDFIYHNRSSELAYVTTSNGPLTFVGK
uniref:Mannan endo-1,4-beta-mannosidase n=1 Tax=Chenopodium quinoa TaxID=63459 RepID=A0A803LHC9_CHEQI